jgi:hypothetical protein
MDDYNKLEPTQNMQGEISLKDLILKIKSFISYLLSKWKVILTICSIGAIMGFIYAFSKKPLYKAELSFVLQDERSGGGLGGALNLASQFGIDLGGSGTTNQFSGDNLIGFMKSRSMIERTLLTPVMVGNKNVTLADFYIDFNDLKKAWANNPRLQGIQFLPNADRAKFSLQQDSVLGSFYTDLVKNYLLVDKIDKKTSIVTIQIKSKNELFSKYFTEVLAKVVSDFYVQTKTKKQAQNVVILQKQVDSVRLALNGAISGVAASLDAAPNANPSLQRLHVPSQRRQVDVQANTAILTELVRNLELSKMALLQETPLIQVIDRPIMPLEKIKVGKIKATVFGGIIGGILIVIILTINLLFKRIMT